ncbi:MAG: hemerythrin domain-containing protein [Anaerolineae bacterium]|nr:hemerythrin domain-containing protein [Anaerolineae bacterium]
MKITEALQVEHDLLRKMMEAMSQWLTESVAPDKLRERAVLLEVAIDDHAAREEQQLFAPLRAYSNSARELISLMEVVHTEVRDLFEEVADPARDPKERLWTILMLTEEHFNKEEMAVFPMAEKLMGAALEARNL